MSSGSLHTMNKWLYRESAAHLVHTIQSREAKYGEFLGHTPYVSSLEPPARENDEQARRRERAHFKGYRPDEWGVCPGCGSALSACGERTCWCEGPLPWRATRDNVERAVRLVVRAADRDRNLAQGDALLQHCKRMVAWGAQGNLAGAALLLVSVLEGERRAA
jgi:hypothetical protein